MRSGLIVFVVVLLAGCGGSQSVHYNVTPALECLQRTNSIRGGGGSKSILLLFASDDGVSAVESVFVSFGPASASGNVATAVGIPSRKPSWTERRGDARVTGYGPYVPPIAKKHNITDAQARSAAGKLGTGVRAAVDDCLQKNER